MKRMKNAFGIAGFLLLVSCATIPHLHLTYRLPIEGKTLAGKKVFIRAEDIRKEKQTFGKGARQMFEKTSEDIALSVAKGAAEGSKKGIYNAPALLKEAMESRLRNEGIQVVPEGETSAGISLALRSFLLDRLDRKWRVFLAYDARLMKDGKELSNEIISGEAERFELVGKEQAEVVLGELLTEVVNRLDLVKLFQKIN